MNRKILLHIFISVFIFQVIFGVFSADTVYGQMDGEAQVEIFNEEQRRQQIQGNYNSAKQELDAAAQKYNDLQRQYPVDQRTPAQAAEIEAARQAGLEASQRYSGPAAEQAKLNAETNKLLDDIERAKAKSCSINPIYFNLSNCFQSMFQLIGNLFLSIAGWGLWIAGTLLNLVLDVTLVHMKGTLENIQGIQTAWTTIRDLANIFFIFVLLYIAISTILGLAGGETKKMLAHVVVAALLINFSLFFTKVIVDASNILAYGFYKNMPGIGNTDPFEDFRATTINTGEGVKKNIGLSGSIMSSLRLQSIYDVGNNPMQGGAAAAATDSISNLFAQPLNFIFATIGGVAFITITAVIFLVTGFLFIIRFVILIFLLILSPLAFVGMILPQLSEYSKKWWETLMGQAIFAPALMMMIWVTLQVAKGIKSTTNLNGNEGFAGVLLAHGSASFGIVLNFFILITMMIASLAIAKEMGSAGGHGLMAYADKFQGFLGRRIVRGVTLERDHRIGTQSFGFTLRKGEYGLRKLDEKFGETKYGNTPFGHAVREYTTGAAANAKFGGEMSAEESFHQDTHLETEREEIGHRENFMKLVKEGATPLEIQRELSQIEPRSFPLLPRDILQDPKYMQFASLAQMQAVKDEKDGRLSVEEKHKAVRASIQHHLDALDKYDELYAEWQKKFDEAIANGIDPYDTKAGGPGAAPSFMKTFPKTRKWLREMPTQGPDLYYWADPNILKRKGTSAWKFGNIDAIRKSQQIGELDKDVARGTKAIDFLTAEDAYMGINMSLPDEVKDKLRDAFNDEYFEGTDLAETNGIGDVVLPQFENEKIEKEFREKYKDSIYKRIDKKTGKEVEAFRYQYSIHSRNASRKLMREAYEGKNPTEILRMRGKHWQTPAVYKILGVDQMRNMNTDKDNGEKEPYVDFMIEELRKEKEGVIDPSTNEPYQMTEETRSVLKWFKTNDRYAKEYLPGYKWKGKEGHPWNQKDIREIINDPENENHVPKER